jgi:hypothetical protein
MYDTINIAWCSSLNNSTMKVISKFKDLTQLNLSIFKLIKINVN